MIGTTVSPTTISVSPTVDLPAAPSLLPSIDLHHVAYRRDDTSYEDLLRALLQNVSVMQKRLAALQGK